MSLPETCIRRPVMTTLLMLAFVIFGMFSYRLLPVAALPRVDFPTIVVSAQFPGANIRTHHKNIPVELLAKVTHPCVAPENKDLIVKEKAPPTPPSRSWLDSSDCRCN